MAKSTETTTTESKAENVTLTFSTDSELDVYAKLSKAAAEDERSLNKFCVRSLKSMYSTSASTDKQQELPLA